MGSVVWIVIWVIGCFFFDAWLGFASPWQMLAGAAVAIIASAFKEAIEA